MSRIRTRLARLERVTATRPECAECSLEGGNVNFVVVPPRVIGEPYVEPPPEPPRYCPACGRQVETIRFVVKPPRTLAAQGDAA